MVKNTFVMQNYDVVVIGAGHAGIEAALASARLGAKTAIFTLSIDAVGNLPCNPSIGGTAKGHLVMEVDALGGEIGKAADATTIQSRVLNKTKGPAVHSLRVQSDRRLYTLYMKQALEKQENLDIIQSEIVAVSIKKERVNGVYSRLGGFYGAKCVVIATGTYLGGKIHIGDCNYHSGPDNIAAAVMLTENLCRLGIPIRRFKTGTPARVHRRSIDFCMLERQGGDEEPIKFSFMTDYKIENLVDCYIAYTNEDTHKVIRDNLDRSPLYGGVIEGIGARYCPSIEDKVVRFPNRNRHQIFVEPCGVKTDEMYLQGMSSSLPLDVQLKMYRTIKGFEKVEIMRPAYAIEYDCCDPLTLYPTLESKSIGGLFGAGQFCGSSGYEEAAAQGIVAGINAARKVLKKDEFTLERSSSYIGTLIDDLVTKGVQDPYRMMTSRSEFRLILRQDNADRRLCETGRKLGLVDDTRYKRYLKRKQIIEKEMLRVKTATIPPSPALNVVLLKNGLDPVHTGITVEQLLKRPGISYADLMELDSGRPEIIDKEIYDRLEVEIKYEGYIARQTAQIEKQKKLENMPLPEPLDYGLVLGLRLEAVEKLGKVRPRSIGQASRISGVNPADIAVLTIWLKKHKYEKRSNEE